jgi:hypothetical protein
MESPQPNTPQDSEDAEKRVAGLTGMTPEAARTFMDFHTGMRWLRPKDA